MLSNEEFVAIFFVWHRALKVHHSNCCYGFGQFSTMEQMKRRKYIVHQQKCDDGIMANVTVMERPRNNNARSKHNFLLPTRFVGVDAVFIVIMPHPNNTWAFITDEFNTWTYASNNKLR